MEEATWEGGVPAQRSVREGGTTFLLPGTGRRAAERGPAHRAPVFYNPAMAISRDLHLCVVEALHQAAGRRLTIWDALAASGIRGARTLGETSAVERLLSTDLQPEAVGWLQKNLSLIDPERSTARKADALEVPPEAPFDLIDLDPYGTPMPFVDTALEAVRPGGVLAITATDMAVLAGPEKDACQRRYGGRPLRNYLCREAGLRILIAAIARRASLRGRRAVPMLSYARDHHVRTYLKIDVARGEGEPPVRAVPFEGYDGPPLLHGVKGGPLWTGSLHDRTIVERMTPIRSAARPKELDAWLALLEEESRLDLLFYYESGAVGKWLGLDRQPPLAELLAALRKQGWQACRTSMEPSGWRTNAPSAEVASLLRELV